MFPKDVPVASSLLSALSSRARHGIGTQTPRSHSPNSEARAPVSGASDSQSAMVLSEVAR